MKYCCSKKSRTTSDAKTTCKSRDKMDKLLINGCRISCINSSAQLHMGHKHPFETMECHKGFHHCSGVIWDVIDCEEAWFLNPYPVVLSANSLALTRKKQITSEFLHFHQSKTPRFMLHANRATNYDFEPTLRTSERGKSLVFGGHDSPLSFGSHETQHPKKGHPQNCQKKRFCLGGALPRS